MPQGRWLNHHAAFGMKGGEPYGMGGKRALFTHSPTIGVVGIHLLSVCRPICMVDRTQLTFITARSATAVDGIYNGKPAICEGETKSNITFLGCTRCILFVCCGRGNEIAWERVGGHFEIAK